MSDEARDFELGAVLSVTTGRLLCPIDRVYDILGFMTGESLFTHQLPRASRECEGPILAQHPALADVVVPESVNDQASALAFLAATEAAFGASFTLTPLAAEDHTSIDPLKELRMMRPDLPIVALVAPPSISKDTEHEK